MIVIKVILLICQRMMNQRLALFSFVFITSLSLLGAACSKQDVQPTADNTAPAVNTTASNNAMTYSLDTNASVLKWNASKVTGKHFGTVKIKSGSLQFENGEPVTGNFVMDMTTITVDDMKEGEKMHGMLFNHLRSDDFFSVEKHPTSTFTATSFTKKENNSYTVNGDLTVKGITKPISFDALITTEGDTAVASALITVDRTEYDIKFRSGKFFSDLGDSLIHDTFTVELNLVANK